MDEALFAIFITWGGQKENREKEKPCKPQFFLSYNETV